MMAIMDKNKFAAEQAAKLLPQPSGTLFVSVRPAPANSQCMCLHLCPILKFLAEQLPDVEAADLLKNAFDQTLQLGNAAEGTLCIPLCIPL